MKRVETYKDQLNRVNRWYSRFHEIHHGSIQEKSAEYYVDEVYAFFMNCYHLKDWIQNDMVLEVNAQEVENFINVNTELSICADICNGLKHFHRKSSRSNIDPGFAERHTKVKLSREKPITEMRFSIQTKTGTLDAFELATKCVALWKDFINTIKSDKNTLQIA
ncbi:unnamed protein product [marine sediment metagenome]|uniref:Uncharacterized protein n=1 Tax=marine sediment metagenome TaxID=412755 RepID=X0TWK1_9ZZZZ